MRGVLFEKFFTKANDFLNRIIPDSFTIAILLTIVVFAGGIFSELFYSGSGITQSVSNCITGWGSGFFTLLEFGMQMSLIILCGYIIAVSGPVNKLLVSVIRYPKSERGVALTVAAVSMLLCFINWGFGLVAGAMLVKTAYSHRRGINYVYLVAVAYLGLGTLWHGGLSGSVPLLLATENHFLVAKTGVIPVSKTIFSASNIVLMLTVFLVMLFLVYMLYPAQNFEVVSFDESGKGAGEGEKSEERRDSFAKRMEESYLLNLVIFTLILVYNFIDIYEGKFSLSLNRVNLIFIGLGFVLHKSPSEFVRAAQSGVSMITGVVIQFPLYAGIYGIIKGTALLNVISHFFISVSSAKTFAFIVFLYSGILNYFVPSGGSKWVIEAPYLIDVAARLNVPVERIAMFYAYGDMWTNLVQPFWAIPLLAAAKIEFRKIIGYELLFAFVYGIIISFASFLL